MTTSSQTHRKFRRLTTILSLGVLAALLFWLAPVRVDSQDAPAAAEKKTEIAAAATRPANTNAAAPAADVLLPAPANAAARAYSATKVFRR